MQSQKTPNNTQNTQQKLGVAFSYLQRNNITSRNLQVNSPKIKLRLLWPSSTDHYCNMQLQFRILTQINVGKIEMVHRPVALLRVTRVFCID